MKSQVYWNTFNDKANKERHTVTFEENLSIKKRQVSNHIILGLQLLVAFHHNVELGAEHPLMKLPSPLLLRVLQPKH